MNHTDDAGTKTNMSPPGRGGGGRNNSLETKSKVRISGSLGKTILISANLTRNGTGIRNQFGMELCDLQNQQTIIISTK